MLWVDDQCLFWGNGPRGWWRMLGQWCLTRRAEVRTWGESWSVTSEPRACLYYPVWLGPGFFCGSEGSWTGAENLLERACSGLSNCEHWKGIGRCPLSCFLEVSDRLGTSWSPRAHPFITLCRCACVDLSISSDISFLRCWLLLLPFFFFPHFSSRLPPLPREHLSVAWDSPISLD